jgi:hypothetical protein
LNYKYIIIKLRREIVGARVVVVVWALVVGLGVVVVVFVVGCLVEGVVLGSTTKIDHFFIIITLSNNLVNYRTLAVKPLF